jgi:DNA-binding transcriptional regulator of glucitol operon
VEWRRFLAPKWVFGHLLVLAAAITMVFLGRWQLDVSNARHFDLQNFGYAFQWWAFSIFSVLLWLKVLRDIIKHDPDTADGPKPVAPVEAPRAYRSYAMPQSTSAPTMSGDGVLSSYNAYLAGLAKKD